jgi:hypothetical protein
MADAARDVLWDWIDDAADPDPEQRGWKRSRLEGVLLACRRTRVLTTDELARWQALMDGGQPAPPAAAEPGAAHTRLEELLGAVRPMTRDEDPDRIRASSRFHGALRALADAGVISEDEQSRWHRQELSASAPWLPTENVEQLVAAGGFIAIGIPARIPEEEAADAAARQEHDRLTLRGTLERVAVRSSPERRDGLAVLGVVMRAECTELLFHFVGPPHGEFAGGFADLSAHSALVETLVPPDLTDNTGMPYEPVAPRPVSSHGTGGTPDPDRPLVFTGVWRYLPAAPESAKTFAATLGSARWTVP